MVLPQSHDPAEGNGAGVEGEVVELTSSFDAAIVSPSEGLHAEPVKGSGVSLAAETTSLLHSRLRAVAILLSIVYSVILLWAVTNKDLGLFGTFDMYQNLAIIRLLILGAILAVLYARGSYTQTFLRGVEYALFGALTLLWIYSRYRAAVYDARAGDITNLLVSGREAMTGLFMLMIVHGLFIPHRWQGTARVVLTMALAPAVTLILFQTLHLDLVEQVEVMFSWRNVTTGILIVCVGALLATYGSGVLNTLRVEAHDAKRLGQYQLVQRIGVGGMGEVFLAEHALMKRPCALKLIRAESAEDPTALARFEREVQTTARLTHPNTIDIFDYGHTDNGTFYYVMEYLPGMSLSELIAKHGPLPPGRVIFLLRQVCRALAEAHGIGLVHRDLKPGNLFVSERGGMCDFIKVLDFGLVKLTKDPAAAQLTLDQMVSGTPLYMAPEQAVGDKGLDARCDLYALGAIAYHMLTGRLPFEGDTAVAIMISHASQEVVAPSHHRPDLPKDLDEVVLRCLAKKPDERYQDSLALEKALAGCAAASEWDAKHAALWWEDISAKR